MLSRRTRSLPEVILLRQLRTFSNLQVIFATTALLAFGLTACAASDDTNAGTPEDSAATEATEDGSSDAGDAGSEQGGDESAPEDATAAAEGECPVREGSSAIVTETPQVDEWTMLDGIALPTSETYGPYVQDGDLWTCYEHSAEGALFATAYMFRASGNVEGFAETWVPEGKLRDEVLKSEQSPPSDPPDWDSMTLAGFRYQSYTDEVAVIDFAVEVAGEGESHFAYLRLAHRWVGDRWMVDYENAGSSTVAMESLDGFVNWRG